MRFLPLLASWFLLASAALAEDPTPIEVAVPQREKPVSFALEISDILYDKCIGCHSSALAENDLNMEEHGGLLKGGKSGPVIVPGKADESLLFQMAAHRVEPVMPPKDKPKLKPLTPEELGLLKLWIDAGAADDTAELAGEAKPIELGTLPPGVQPIVAVDMTADGRQVAAGRANLVQVYDPVSGLEIVSLAGHRDIIQSLAYSPDGKQLASGGYQIVKLWNCPTGSALKTFSGHGDQVKALAVAADGKTFVSGSADRSIRLWDAAEGKELKRINHPAPSSRWPFLPTARPWFPAGRTTSSGSGTWRMASSCTS